MNDINHGYRIKLIKEGTGFNWLFLPGGPGLGSEYLVELCNKLSLPGSIMLLDFPKDGTNPHGTLSIQYWREGLIAILKSYDNPILVTHSFAGMLSLTMPEIENYLAGLVLMNTTTADTFFDHITAMREQHGLPDLLPAAAEYHLNPSDQTYKQFWYSYKYYCFTPEELPAGEQIMQQFAFNNAAYSEAINHFYLSYSCSWYPTLIPTLTIASEQDYICPPQAFIANEQFQSKNVINKLIEKAGHFPWITQFEAVQNCFDEFINLGQLIA